MQVNNFLLENDQMGKKKKNLSNI